MADPIAAALDKATTPDVDGKRMIVNVAVSALSLKTGETYSHASGVTSLFPNSNDAEAAKPMALDSVCFIASCTKLMTTVAALQCVEQGLVALDDDLAEKMEELKDIQILKGFDDRGEPILEKAKNKVTLRLLLTHSSGFSYDVSHPLLLQWRKWRGEAPGTLSGSFVSLASFSPLGFSRSGARRRSKRAGGFSQKNGAVGFRETGLKCYARG
jgi:CubicO group peptidase (beta-lactamase class C family)